MPTNPIGGAKGLSPLLAVPFVRPRVHPLLHAELNRRYPLLLLEPYGYPDAETGYQTTFLALQSWLLGRLAWLDGAFNKPIVLPDGPPSFDPATGAQEFVPSASPVSASG